MTCIVNQPLVVGSHSILVSGGSEGGRGNECESYDIASDKWSPFPDMNVDRYIFGLVEFQGSVYAIWRGRWGFDRTL